MCVIILIGNLTAYSQITGISREQKIEIVSTLQVYPLVLNELDLMNETIVKLQDINVLFYQEIKNYEKQVSIYEELNARSEEQIEILKKQLKQNKKRGGWVIPTLSGVAIGIITGTMLNK